MIALQEVQKNRDNATLLQIPHLQVAAGEVVAVVGSVGSGRQELWELLLGKTRPTVGMVTLDGIDPNSAQHDFSQQVGVMFAEDTLYLRQSPLSNLQFHGRLRGLPTQRIHAVLAEVGLADQARTKLEKLPSGSLRRLAFGIATLHQPPMLLLAEPFARCDEASIRLLQKLIREQKSQETAVLILADTPTHLENLCDTLYFLENGRISNVRTPAEEQEQQNQYPFKIPVRLEDSVALVNPVDILYAEVQDGRTYLQIAEQRLPTQFTMVELEERLSRSGFFRAHRGYLVNLQHVTEVISYTRSSFSLKLDDPAETKIPLSKDAARELRELLGY